MSLLRSAARATLTSGALVLALAVCDDPTAPRRLPERPALHVNDHPTGSPAVLIGAGDIANCNNDNDGSTARLLDGISGTVMALGDIDEHAAAGGTGTDGLPFPPYPDCYSATWGRHKGRTHAVIGNIDYTNGNDANFATYWGAAAGEAGKFYYAFELGDWQVIALNSNNAQVRTAAGFPQEQWLRQTLRATTKPCVAVLVHHPRFVSSTTAGANTIAKDLKAFWDALYEYGADLVASGNKAHYERLAQMDPDGNLAPGRGIRQFVVGTGGSTLDPNDPARFLSKAPNYEALGADYGVLKLTLSAGGYDWEFVPARNRYRDASAATVPCNGPTVATTVSLTSSLSPSTYNQSVAFTATVTGGGSAVQIGSVTFMEGESCTDPAAKTLGGPVAVDAAGQASLTKSDLPATADGSPHQVIACYNATGSFMAGSSAAMAQAVSKAQAHVMIGGLEHTYDGAGKSATVTTSPADLTTTVQYSRGAEIVASPTNAGVYTVTATVDDPNYEGSGTNELTIAQAAATVTLSGLTHTYDGTPKPATAATTPANLGVALSYDGSATAPTSAGTYAVSATVSDPNYTGSTTGTLTIGRATPTITWSNPARISYGTALSGTQLNATASVPGSFAYTPGAGTVLDAGAGQELRTTFTPSDAANYTTAEHSVLIDVGQSSQTITFPTLQNRTYGDAPFTPGATASSDLPVSYAAVGDCSVTATNTIRIDGAGDCTVTASQAGDANFAPAAHVSRSFAIAKKTATVTLNDLSHTYDGSGKEARATTVPAGLSVRLSYTRGGASVGSPTDAGDYAVDAVVEDPDHQGSTTGTLTIAKAALTVTADDKSRAAGEANPTLTGTITGVVAGDGITPKFATAADENSAAGPYPITSDIDDPNGRRDNYAITLVDGTLTVTAPPGGKQDQTIDFAQPADKTYGDAPFDVSATATSGLAVSFAAAGNCTVSGSTVTPGNAGTCTVTASQAGNDEWNPAADVARTFTIHKAMPTITWNRPADIKWGTALGSTQLNATASVAGTFTYDPPAGTKMNDGLVQTLSTTFAPADATNYESASKQVRINVLNLIDVMPGTTSNIISLSSSSQARFSVAVLTTPVFNAATVDVATALLGNGTSPDAPVMKKSDGTWDQVDTDVDGDGDKDKLLYFERKRLVDNGDLVAGVTTKLVLNFRVTTTGQLARRGTDKVSVIN